MLSPEEWEQRKSQIGASDVPKIFNFDNKGAYDLWLEKTGQIEKTQFENKYTIAGNMLEDRCLIYAYNQLGINNHSMDDRVEHPEIKGFVVSLDGLDLDNNVPVENKTIKHTTYYKNVARFNERGLEDTTYYRQLQAQISVLNASGGWLIYNVLGDYDYIYPELYEPNEIIQERRFHKRDEKMIKEIDSRVSYMLKCMKHKIKPSENTYLKYLKTRRKIK